MLAGFTAFMWPLRADPSTKVVSSDNSEPAKSCWNQPYLFGDWGGGRSKLESQGVTFDFNNVGDFLTDVTGSPLHHATYFGIFTGSTDIDFNKLSGFDGEFSFSAIWQYGRNLSALYLHTNTATSSIADDESERIDNFWYQQGFIDEMFKVKLGQIDALNEFGSTDFFDVFVNGELGYIPTLLYGTRQPYSPVGKPGIILRGDLSDLAKGLYVKAGAFTAYDNPYRPDSNGVYFQDDFNHGIAADFEIGYQESNETYPGVYRVGLNANNLGKYMNPATGVNLNGNYTAYGIIEKTVYHPKGVDGKPDVSKGLDILAESVGGPGDRDALDFEFMTGVRYTGLLPGRDADKTGLGVVYSNNSPAFSAAYHAANGRGLTGETTVELNYQYNPTPWLSIQPDIQNIIDPGGDTRRSDILVLGIRTTVRF